MITSCLFGRVLDESKGIDAFFNERDKDYSDMIKTLANEVKLYFITFKNQAGLEPFRVPF